MKESKKRILNLPEVHILGDLEDVKNLVAGVNKKKTIVVFQDGEQGSYYLEVDGEIQMILPDDVKELEKEYRLIFFSFFPGRKKAEPAIEEKPLPDEPENPEIKEKEEKKIKKKKELTAKKEKKRKHHRKEK